MITTETLSRMADIIIVVTFIAVCFSITFYTIIDAVCEGIAFWKKKRKARKAEKENQTKPAEEQET